MKITWLRWELVTSPRLSPLGWLHARLHTKHFDFDDVDYDLDDFDDVCLDLLHARLYKTALTTTWVVNKKNEDVRLQKSKKEWVKNANYLIESPAKQISRTADVIDNTEARSLERCNNCDILYFVFCNLYFVFVFCFFVFCILHFVFSFLYFVFCILY